MKHTKIILALIAVLNMTATTMAQTTSAGYLLAHPAHRRRRKAYRAID